MARIFISYRKSDSAGHAGWLNQLLSEQFGQHEIFRDIDTLEPGVDFVEAIRNEVGTCDVLLAMIGAQWRGAADGAGRRRLDDPDDFVRLEITTALERGIRVIPVLVQDAKMPPAEQLPDALRPLARRQAFELDDASWRTDVQRLAAALEKILGSQNRPRPEAQPGDAPAAEAAFSRIFHVSSLAEIEKLSGGGRFLLFADRSERGLGEQNAYNSIQKDVFPEIGPIARAKRVVLGFTNIGHFYHIFPSDLVRYLSEQKLKFVGCFLFQNGQVRDARKTTYLDHDDYVRAARLILDALDPVD